MLLIKKMAPLEFKWTLEAENAMANLRNLVVNTVPIRVLDFRLATQVKPKNQRESDLGLVTIQVNSSVIGVGWMISQCHEDQEYPIVFGSITFNPVKSRYSQPKLELYRVLRAFKAKRHRLYHIHFKLQIDASSLIQMIDAPDLPNAAMTRWIMYIKMFSFEIEHNQAEKHKVPDGLSRRQKSDNDSDYSDGDIDVDEGLKLVQVLTCDLEQEFH